MTWTLVAFIWYSGAAAITVPGFKSEAACVAAANELQKDLTKGFVPPTVKVACVEVK